VTSALPADFEIGAPNDVSLIAALSGKTSPSWATIMKKIYNNNRKLSALTQVNGDGDNP